jgi:hypothetical protein
LVTQIYNRKLKLQNKSENIFEVLKFAHKKPPPENTTGGGQNQK